MQNRSINLYPTHYITSLKEYYVQEIFDSSELIANLDKNAIKVEHSVYDYLIYDSGVESRFAKSLDEDPDVKMFFKIPSRFKIDTPIGAYNPDWAVFLEKDGEQKLYFVLESKGTTSLFDLRTPEKLKIHCGKQHFDSLDDISFSEEVCYFCTAQSSPNRLSAWLYRNTISL